MLKSKHTFQLYAEDKTKGAFDSVAKGINGVIKVGGVLAAGYVALTTKIVNATKTQQAAISQLAQGIESTNGVVGRSVDELVAYAQELQKASIFGDEEIIAAQSQLLTFTKITGEQFDKTTQLAMDLSVRMGTDLKSSVIQLGKALNDPLANLSALSRSGIQFSDSQKTMIRSLIESGKMLEAQNIILAELETQFGGSAKAARDDLGGALKALQNATGDLFEADAETAQELAGSLNELTDFLQDPETIKAAQEFTAAMIGGLKGVLEFAKETHGVIKFMAEEMAAFIHGAAIGDMVRLEDELASLIEKREKYRQYAESPLSFVNYQEYIDKTNKEIEATKNKIKVTEELIEQDRKRRKELDQMGKDAIDAAGGTRDLSNANGELGDSVQDLINPFLQQQEQLNDQIKLFGKTKEEARLLNLEEQIRIERAKLGEQATSAQVIQFEQYAGKLRAAAQELNALSMAEEARKQLNEGAEETGEVVDLAEERAKRLEIEAQTMEQTRALRDNAHQQRMAQIAGHITDEQGLRLQQYDLERQQLQQKFLSETELRNLQFAEEMNQIREQERLIAENKAISDEEKQARLMDLRTQELELDAAHKAQVEAAEKSHNDRLADITQRRVEFEAQLKEQQRQRDLQGASQFFGNLASLSNSGSKKLFKIAQAAAIGQTIVNTYAAAQKAMAEISYPLNIAVAASQVIAGLNRVKQIKAQKFGGSGGGSASAGGGGTGGTTGGGSLGSKPAGGVVSPSFGNQFDKKDEAPAQMINITIAGDVNSNGVEGWAEKLKALINEKDFNLIDRNSRNAQDLMAASGGG